jgi:hypothetical protein
MAIFAVFVALRVYCACLAETGTPLVILDRLPERDVRVSSDYAIVTPNGSAVGVLDGEALTGPRRLARGRHVFVSSADSRLAVVWAPALQRGLKSSGLFTAIDR